MSRLFKIITASLFLIVMTIRPLFAAENPYGTQGVSHIGLAVSKLDQSANFFVETLGWKMGGRNPDYPSVFVNNGSLYLTLWQVEDPQSATPFDRRKNIGLHHLAIKVESLEKLHALHEKLKNTPNIRIEFAPELLGNGPWTHMMLFDPSGIRLEFIAPGK